MPIGSSYASFTVPEIDLWDFMFARDHDFPTSQIIYRDLHSNRSYTFAQVKSTAQAFGEALLSLWNWQIGNVFSILAPNNVDYGVAVYGILYAGGIVAPANPSYNAEEYAVMLRNSCSKAILTHQSLLPLASEAAAIAGIPTARIILLGDQTDSERRAPSFLDLAFSAQEPFRGKVHINPGSDLGFLVYSSGTTGLPKGVMLSHTNIVSNVLMISQSVGINYHWRHDKILGLLPFYHIYGLTGLLHQCLSRGIELVVMPKFSLDAFCLAVKQHRITLTYVAPPVIVQLSRNSKVNRHDLQSLRMITCGAAPLTKELIYLLHSKLGLKVNQAYGLSETSPMTHTQAWSDWKTTAGSVGKLFPNMIAKYMDEDGNEVEAGERGELWLKGPNVFKGYWKDAEATSTAITPDGFFKTGDVGYQDSEHNFFISDRVKELIKYNGFQVPPAELEGLLLGCSLVQDVAVIGIYDEQHHTEVPRAFVVLAPGYSPSSSLADQIRRWLNERVIYYKRLRGGVQFVSFIPKSPAGKILRRALKTSMAQSTAPQAKL